MLPVCCAKIVHDVIVTFDGSKISTTSFGAIVELSNVTPSIR
jgi:hypothetical protein